MRTGRHRILLLSVLLCLSAAVPADIPPGYYDPAEGLTGEALQSALHDIIDDHASISYDAVWDAFYTTDDKPNGKVWDMYSDVPGGTPPYEYTFGVHQGGSASQEGEGYNREHSWPRSWFGGEVSPMNSDLFQIVPTDIYVNNRRSNHPFAEVSYPTWTSLNGSRLGPSSTPGYSGTAFEPRDEYKGDMARNYFYMATRYYGEDGSWPGGPMSDGAVLDEWAVDMLLDWHSADPVSDKELERNEAVYDIQGNRNPFIDRPDFACLVYDPTSVEQGLPPAVAEPSCSPNPFVSTTTVTFSTASPGPVTAVVMDTSGRSVATLADGDWLPSGTNELVWNVQQPSGGVPPGVYLLVIRSGGDTFSARVVLLD